MFERIKNYQGGGEDFKGTYLNGRVEKTQAMPQPTPGPCNAQNLLTESVNPPFRHAPASGSADYVAVEGGFITPVWSGATVRITLDRNGSVYVSGGVAAGTPGPVAGIVAGSFDRKGVTPDSFLPGTSVTFGAGGPIGGVGKAAVAGNGTATEFGISSELGANYSCSRTVKLFDSPVRW